MTKTELPLFGLSSFEEAVGFFKSLGFQVEPGPGPEEVTLILDAPDYRTCCVYPVSMLPQMAALAWHVRFLNKRKHARSGRRRKANQSAAGRTRVSLSAGNSSQEASN